MLVSYSHGSQFHGKITGLPRGVKFKVIRAVWKMKHHCVLDLGIISLMLLRALKPALKL